MNTKESIRELENELREPLTRLMRIINVYYCDVATPNDIFEIREGKYQLIKTIYSEALQNDIPDRNECFRNGDNNYK